MKLVKVFGLTTIALLFVTALVGVSSAMASSSLLCSKDSLSEPPPVGECQQPTEVHFISVNATGEAAKVKLLNEILLPIECNALLSGTVLPGLVANGPVVIHVTELKYTNCGICSISASELGLLSVLRTGVELATVTSLNLKLLFSCFGLDCEYGVNGLTGHGLGPLLTELSAHITYTKLLLMRLTPGCTKIVELDALFASVNPLYIRS